MARGIAVREAISEEKRIIEKSQKAQNQKLKEIEQSKYKSRQQAEKIGRLNFPKHAKYVKKISKFSNKKF